jgi:caffeoyl-CoA O-methyltransferase
VNEAWTAIARRHWQAAGVADRIELRLGPALETLRSLPRDPVVDLSFVDADKEGYRAYYEELLVRTRPNGLILFDNVLWGGQVLEGEGARAEARAIQALNDALASDPGRVGHAADRGRPHDLPKARRR